MDQCSQETNATRTDINGIRRVCIERLLAKMTRIIGVKSEEVAHSLWSSGDVMSVIWVDVRHTFAKNRCRSVLSRCEHVKEPIGICDLDCNVDSLFTMRSERVKYRFKL
jgi:hypothetical protein